MKKYSLLLYFITASYLAALALAPGVMAATLGRQEQAQNTDSQRQAQQREDIQAQKGEMRGTIEQNRQQVRAKIAQGHANRLQNRFMIYHKRLSGLASKMQTRFALMAESGKDIAISQDKVTQAQTELDNAQSLAEQTVDQFMAISEDEEIESQNTMAAEARDLAEQCRQAFKAAHELLVEAIMLAKESN